MGRKKITLSDSLGEVEVPADALYQAQTQRAIDNFNISPLRLPVSMIRALALLKQGCAIINTETGMLEAERGAAIAAAAADIAAGKHAGQFPLDVFQTGSGTSSNMNLNEVIATLAGSDTMPVDANDHVNMGQSSNDIFPSAIHVAASLQLHESLLPQLHRLESSLTRRAEEQRDTIKTGRTHLMDAMPLSLGQEISAWASQVKNDRYRIQSALTRVQQLAVGGTAVGTGINTADDFGTRVCQWLETETAVRFKPMENLFEALSTQNTALELSGQLRVLAASLTKICNDLRWMNSGPLSGLAEISLKPLQPGSSIMPSKVNPVIPEAVLMVAAQVNGNDSTILQAALSGNFQLNVMLPVIAYNLLQSIDILANACGHLAGAVDDFGVNRENMAENLSRNPILATALNPIIGYRQAAEIAKKALRENRPVIEVALEMTDIDRSRLVQLLDPGALVGKPSQKPR